MIGRRALTAGEAEAVWTILVELAGAREDADSRQAFVRYATKGEDLEYRFQGALGFGGKFYWDGWKARIGFYNENHTLLREAIRECVDRRLAVLFGHEPRPMPGADALLEACVGAMDGTGRAHETLRRLRFERMDADRARRPAAREVRHAEAVLAGTRDALDAAALRAREYLAAAGRADP